MPKLRVAKIKGFTVPMEYGPCGIGHLGCVLYSLVKVTMPYPQRSAFPPMACVWPKSHTSCTQWAWWGGPDGIEA